MTAPSNHHGPPDAKNPPGATGGLNKESLLDGDEGSLDSKCPSRTQQAIAGLQRDFAAEALRIAAVKASHAADNVGMGDDAVAEHDISIAIKYLREGATAFRELERLTEAHAAATVAEAVR